MGKRKLRGKWLDFLIAAQKYGLNLKKSWRNWSKKSRPYLALRFWPIYILAFSFGFYLWGPNHGAVKVKTWLSLAKQHQATPTIESLQKELQNLKLKLGQTSPDREVAAFNPALFSRPALGEVIQGFEWLATGNSWRLHAGVDIVLVPGSNILAAAQGTVNSVVQTKQGAYSVTIDHGNDWLSVYQDLASTLVVPGQKVIKGVVVGASGISNCASGQNGFHFSIYHHGEPIDPEKVIAGLVK